jgi:hypothetical protein
MIYNIYQIKKKIVKLETMILTVIHYSEEADFKLRKIEIKNQLIRCKPHGGIWASPADSKDGWDKWCDDEVFVIQVN